MLKEKAPATPLIMAYKLITGEEIIAEQVDVLQGFIEVKNPLAMVMAENPENPAQTRVMFTPWMVAANKGKIDIREQHIVGAAIAREDAAEQYRQAVAE
jgi:hypothetical protein